MVANARAPMHALGDCRPTFGECGRRPAREDGADRGVGGTAARAVLNCLGIHTVEKSSPLSIGRQAARSASMAGSS